MIYPTMITFKEKLAEALQLPVLIGDVPSKTKKPYVTISLESLSIGNGVFLGSFIFEASVTLWIETQRQEQAQNLIKKIQTLAFPLRYTTAEGEAILQKKPVFTLRTEKSALGYTFRLHCRGKTAPSIAA